MKKLLLIALLIVGFGFCENLPPKSILQNMTYDQKLDLYNSEKITLLKNILPHTRLPLLPHQLKMIVYGSIICGSIITYGALAENIKLGNILVKLGFSGIYTGSFYVLIDKEKQRKLFNETLYEEIFFSPSK
tara:strand:- start:581 stop:976 length:396 start_codon:yes stop_codon:yes gene_type:complete